MTTHPLLLTVLLLAATSCGRNDDKTNVTEQTPRASQDARPQAAVILDGQSVPYVALGEAAAYSGVLTAHDGLFQFTTGRALHLDAPATLLLKESAGRNSDCEASDLTGPHYMIVKVKDGASGEIVRSTEGIETGEGPVPPTKLATFPGALDAGTYVIAVDFISVEKTCHVSGHFTLSE